MDVDRHVLLSQAGEVERRSHGVRFFVVTDVHPTFDGLLSGSFIEWLGLEMGDRSSYLGWKTSGCWP